MFEVTIADDVLINLQAVTHQTQRATRRVKENVRLSWKYGMVWYCVVLCVNVNYSSIVSFLPYLLSIMLKHHDMLVLCRQEEVAQEEQKALKVKEIQEEQEGRSRRRF